MSDPSNSPNQNESPRPNFNPVAWWATIAGICAIIIFGSVFITLSYRRLSLQQAKDPRPLFTGKLETELQATNRDGREVALSQLKGKIFVVANQYVNCPMGCLGMAGVMTQLQGKFADREDFHLVSISLQPGEDTPEETDAWIKQHGVDAPNWWFLTGDSEKIRSYVNRYFQFYKPVENTDPVKIASIGKYSHDIRLALVDGRANVRGYYAVMDTERGPDEIKRLTKDIEYLIREKEGGLNPIVWWFLIGTIVVIVLGSILIRLSQRVT